MKKWLFLWLAVAIALWIMAIVSACHAEELTASYYSVQSLKEEGTYAYSHGRMANGKYFSDNSLTSACNSFRLGVMLRVVNLSNNRSVIVKNTDRTAKRFKGKRIDLTPAAFKAISDSGTTKEGLLKISVEAI